MQPAAGLIATLLAGGALAAEPVDPVAAAVQMLRGGDIVILGEIHDNPEHHRVQAAIVGALQPAALVFEMFPQDDEDLVNSLREEGADRDALAEALRWSERGWPSFDFYADILDAAPEARVFGAEQPLAEVKRSMAEGAAAAFGPDAATYGLDQPLPPEEQAAREAMQAAAHCDALPPEMLPGMVEAQRFRDAGLADAALWARTMTGEGQVVVIAGSGHADKLRGVPAVIAVADPELVVRSLGQFEAGPEDAGAFDQVLVATAPERADPCAQFRD
jgi:uncharacterized iron-regulated protein